MELRGPTLTLRFPREEDAERLFALGSDPGVAGWFSWGPYRSPAQPRAWIAEQAQRRDAGRHLEFVILRGGELVGVTGLNELSVRDRRAMVGTWLGREAWGTGVNAESKALVGHLAFRSIGLQRLGAYSNVANARSAAALERIGFVREGTLRAWHRHGDVHHDVHVFGMLRAEWEASPLAGVPVAVVGRVPEAWAVEPELGGV